MMHTPTHTEVDGRLPVRAKQQSVLLFRITRYRFSNGDEYRGEFRRGMRHGSGVYISQRSDREMG